MLTAYTAAKLADALNKLNNSELFDIASDIDIEDKAHNLNDYDRSDLIGVITDHATNGFKNGWWTIEGWIQDVITPATK